MSEKPKFIFTCQKNGRCCYTRDPIKVYLRDIYRWWLDGTFNTAFPHLKLDIASSMTPTEIRIEKVALKKDEKRSGEEKYDAVCPLLDREKKECTIYSTRPLSCKAFPLGYNGKNFILRDVECPGIDKGPMTTERLKEMRTAAKQEHTSNKTTVTLLPAMQSLFMKELTELAMKEMAAQKAAAKKESTNSTPE